MSGQELEAKVKLLFLQSMDGDKVSYECFLNLCASLAKKYLHHMGGRYAGNQDIEDLTQEIILSLHQKKHTYRWDKPFLPWFYSIIRHRYIDCYRSKKRQPEMIAIDTEFERTFSFEEKFLDESLEDVLMTLNPKQKEMLYMIKIDGASYAEAAKKLSLTVPSVKVTVHRIIKSIKAKVQNEK